MKREVLLIAALAISADRAGQPLLPGSQRSPWFGEQMRREDSPSGVRMFANAPEEMRPERPIGVIFCSTLNSSPIEQTTGCRAAPVQTSIPPSPKDTHGGLALMKQVALLDLASREAVLQAELMRGNLPEFLRRFVTIRVSANNHTGSYEVMPDYLSVGSKHDFIRVPLTPMAAQAIADAFGCNLPTRKMVNDIYAQAQVKLEPRPMTENREAVETFIQHNSIIEGQRAGQRLGLLVGGIKKDVVVTDLLLSRPGHVAIYGWHKLDGTPIQPLTTVHVNTYVDYSHGIRLVKRSMIVDGRPRDIREVLADPELCPLVSDEGPITKAYYSNRKAGD